jgi:hypothetical protein
VIQFEILERQLAEERRLLRERAKASQRSRPRLRRSLFGLRAGWVTVSTAKGADQAAADCA